jgi:hypothetical protein
MSKSINSQKCLEIEKIFGFWWFFFVFKRQKNLLKKQNLKEKKKKTPKIGRDF